MRRSTSRSTIWTDNVFHDRNSPEVNQLRSNESYGELRNRIVNLDPDLDPSAVSIGFWTSVSISDELARSLITSYMSVEHPVYGFFDSYLFMRSLLLQDIQFCSPLLVNAILFWTSVNSSCWKSC